MVPVQVLLEFGFLVDKVVDTYYTCSIDIVLEQLV